MTKTDSDFIQLLADGHSTKELAQISKYQESSIGVVRRRLVQKYDAKNAANLIALAFRGGYIK